MSTCAACGHELGLGRFCTSCGHPVEGPKHALADDLTADAEGSDWRTDTAERLVPRTVTIPEQQAGPQPSPPPPVPGPARVPPAAVTPPPPPRFPLYADEVQLGPETPADHEVEEPLVPFLTVDDQVGGEIDEPERRSWLSWLAALLALAVLAVGIYGVYAFVLDDPGSPSDSQATDEPDQSSGKPTPTDVSAQATAHAPETAAPSEDVDGELVSYDASNMLDGVPETAWRTAGDATGMRLTFNLAAPTTLTEIGILNGYAKRSKDAEGRVFDWYRGNRRVEAVVWQLGKTATIRQKLGADRSVQSMTIEPVKTRKVVVRLVQVSAPGAGRAGRDYTAISEIVLLGLPA